MFGCVEIGDRGWVGRIDLEGALRFGLHCTASFSFLVIGTIHARAHCKTCVRLCKHAHTHTQRERERKRAIETDTHTHTLQDPLHHTNTNFFTPKYSHHAWLRVMTLASVYSHRAYMRPRRGCAWTHDWLYVQARVITSYTHGIIDIAECVVDHGAVRVLAI